MPFPCEFQPLPGPGGKMAYVMVMGSGGETDKFQHVASFPPAITHRPRFEWFNYRASPNDKPMPALKVYEDEVPLDELAAVSDDFRRVGNHSLRWLQARWNLRITIPRVQGSQKPPSESDVIRQALRDLVKSGEWKTANDPKGSIIPESRTPPVVDPVLAAKTDAELEEGIAMAGADLPRDWKRLDRRGRERAYQQATATAAAAVAAK